MLHPVNELTYTILLCDNLEVMKRFYSELFPVEPYGASDTSVILRLGSTQFVLRQRTRAYDGQGLRLGLPGVQLCFRVAPEEREICWRSTPRSAIRGDRHHDFFMRLYLASRGGSIRSSSAASDSKPTVPWHVRPPATAASGA